MIFTGSQSNYAQIGWREPMKPSTSSAWVSHKHPLSSHSGKGGSHFLPVTAFSLWEQTSYSSHIPSFNNTQALLKHRHLRLYACVRTRAQNNDGPWGAVSLLLQVRFGLCKCWEVGSFTVQQRERTTQHNWAERIRKPENLFLDVSWSPACMFNTHPIHVHNLALHTHACNPMLLWKHCS